MWEINKDNFCIGISPNSWRMCPLLYEVHQSASVKKQKKALCCPPYYHSISLFYSFLTTLYFNLIPLPLGRSGEQQSFTQPTPSSLLPTFNHFTLLSIFKTVNIKKKKDGHYQAQNPFFYLSPLSLQSLWVPISNV